MKALKILLTLAFVTLVFVPSDIFAAVIYDNGGPDINTAYFSDPSYYIYRVADDFTLESGSNTITDIHWWGVYAYGNTPEPTDDFTLTIYDTSATASLPGTEVYTNNIGGVTRTDSGFTMGGTWDIYYYSIIVDPISLTAGQSYWLEIINNTIISPDFWAWAGTSGDESHAVWGAGLSSDSWSVDLDNLAFNLTNDATPVPEPSTFILLGGGLIGLAFAIRRRSKE